MDWSLLFKKVGDQILVDTIGRLVDSIGRLVDSIGRLVDSIGRLDTISVGIVIFWKLSYKSDLTIFNSYHLHSENFY